jgi:hypothetical protein
MAPTGEGFHQIAPETGYDAARGFGYTEGTGRATAFDQNRRVTRDVLVLDDVTRDGIYGGTPFRVDLPDGDYHVVVLTGQLLPPRREPARLALPHILDHRSRPRSLRAG